MSVESLPTLIYSIGAGNCKSPPAGGRKKTPEFSDGADRSVLPERYFAFGAAGSGTLTSATRKPMKLWRAAAP